MRVKPDDVCDLKITNTCTKFLKRREDIISHVGLQQTVSLLGLHIHVHREISATGIFGGVRCHFKVLGNRVVSPRTVLQRLYVQEMQQGLIWHKINAVINDESSVSISRRISAERFSCEKWFNFLRTCTRSRSIISDSHTLRCNTWYIAESTRVRLGESLLGGEEV